MQTVPMIIEYELHHRKRVLDLGCNTSSLLLPCYVCGRQNIKSQRIDCEFFGEPVDSYCVTCWAKDLYS